MSLRDDWAANRRTYLLRVLAEQGWTANESVLYDAAQAGGFGRDTRDDIRADIDHLISFGCVTMRWAGPLRVVTLTERGDDAARGKVGIEGVKRSVWTPASER